MSVPLTLTGRETITITASPKEAYDPDGDLWYVKAADHDQDLQLRFLADLGLPVPEAFQVDEENIAVKDAGTSLDRIFSPDDKPGAEDLVRSSGALLSRVHTALGFFDTLPSEETWPQADPATSADPVSNFVHRFVEARSAATNAMSEGKLPGDASEVRGKLLDLASLISESGIPDDLLDGDETSYGDYKPGNILSGGEGGLYLIDPLLHKGNRVGDIAKFCSRFALEPHAPDIEVASHFLSGYQGDSSEHRFNEEQFLWLSALDTANILSGYLGRLARGDERFRIVDQLAHNPDYSARVCDLLDTAMGTLESAHER